MRKPCDHRQRTIAAANATTSDGEVVNEDTVNHCCCATGVPETATILGITTSDRHSGKANGLAVGHRKNGKSDSTIWGPLNCHFRGSRSHDGDVVAQVWQGTGQIDRAIDGELDDVLVAGLTHHNSETGSYGKVHILSKPRLLPFSCATFR